MVCTSVVLHECCLPCGSHAVELMGATYERKADPCNPRISCGYHHEVHRGVEGMQSGGGRDGTR